MKDVKKRIVRDVIIGGIILLMFWFFLADKTGQLWFMLRDVGNGF